MKKFCSATKLDVIIVIFVLIFFGSSTGVFASSSPQIEDLEIGAEILDNAAYKLGWPERTPEGGYAIIHYLSPKNTVTITFHGTAPAEYYVSGSGNSMVGEAEAWESEHSTWGFRHMVIFKLDPYYYAATCERDTSDPLPLSDCRPIAETLYQEAVAYFSNSPSVPAEPIEEPSTEQEYTAPDVCQGVVCQPAVCIEGQSYFDPVCNPVNGECEYSYQDCGTAGCDANTGRCYQSSTSLCAGSVGLVMAVILLFILRLFTFL